jgi:23S rRNA (guanosine2251-2'-O)-methyltransferase
MRKPHPPRRDRQKHDRSGTDRPRATEKPLGKERAKFARPQARDERPAHRDERPSRRDDRPKRGEERPAGRVEAGHRRPPHAEHRKPEHKPLFRARKSWRPPVRDRDGPVFLYGWHSVKAALENPARKFHKIMVTENALHRLREAGMALSVEPQLVRAEEIDALVGPDAVHQGLLVEADPLTSPDIEEVAASGIVLVLDQITDPHNVGAILRTAAAFGVTAVITTQRHAPEATGVLAKAASGALDLIPVVTVPNLARALDVLKRNNVFVVGLDSEGDASFATVPMRAPLALVIGAEGRGLRQLTRATCDAVARLDLPGQIKSLNVSNATALALFIANSRIAPDAGDGVA